MSAQEGIAVPEGGDFERRAVLVAHPKRSFGTHTSAVMMKDFRIPSHSKSCGNRIRLSDILQSATKHIILNLSEMNFP